MTERRVGRKDAAKCTGIWENERLMKTVLILDRNSTLTGKRIDYMSRTSQESRSLKGCRTENAVSDQRQEWNAEEKMSPSRKWSWEQSITYGQERNCSLERMRIDCTVRFWGKCVRRWGKARAAQDQFQQGARNWYKRALKASHYTFLTIQCHYFLYSSFTHCKWRQRSHEGYRLSSGLGFLASAWIADRLCDSLKPLVSF